MKEAKVHAKTKLFALIACCIALSLALVGCGNGSSEDYTKNFAGEWEASEVVSEGEAVSAEDLEFMKSLDMTCTLTLGEDGTAVLDIFGEKEEGTWEAKSATECSATFDGEDMGGVIEDEKMKKGRLTLIAALALAMVMTFALTACGGSGLKGVSKSGDVVSAEIPNGWSFVAGTDMNGSDLADFICDSEEYTLGDPYLQVDDAAQTMDDFVEVLKSTVPFGEYYGEKKLANGTWYISELAAAVQLEGSDKVLRVRSYECDLQDAEVQQIMGSLQWVSQEA